MKRFSAVSRAFALGALLLGSMYPAGWAQAGTLGNMQGTVRNATTGAPIAGVHLEIASKSQVVNVVTDARGHFVAFSLQPDDYTLTAEKSGYDTRSVSGYDIFADQTQVYDLQLSPASNNSAGT
jgi:hypothetical protein